MTVWRIWDYETREFAFAEELVALAQYSGPRFLWMSPSAVAGLNHLSLWTGDTLLDEAGRIYLVRPNGRLLDADMNIVEELALPCTYVQIKPVLEMSLVDRHEFGVPDRWVLRGPAIL